jgi:aminopeptidase N
LKNEEFATRKRLHLALETNGITSRQGVAGTLPSIPEEFREEYETLLNDKSYQTQEIALYNLWNNFPEYRLDT